MKYTNVPYVFTYVQTPNFTYWFLNNVFNNSKLFFGKKKKHVHIHTLSVLLNMFLNKQYSEKCFDNFCGIYIIFDKCIFVYLIKMIPNLHTSSLKAT